MIRIFLGLVTVVVLLFAAIYIMLGSYELAVLALLLGVLWMVTRLGTFCFVAFVALTVIASLSGVPTPLALLGMSANLAAWDMSRFLDRLDGEDVWRTPLAAYHLRVLSVVIALGFGIALLACFLRLSLPFGVMGMIALLAVLLLRRSVRSMPNIG